MWYNTYILLKGAPFHQSSVSQGLKVKVILLSKMANNKKQSDYLAVAT